MAKVCARIPSYSINYVTQVGIADELSVEYGNPVRSLRGLGDCAAVVLYSCEGMRNQEFCSA